MNILIVSVVYPYPVDAGGSAGTFKMIDYLRESNLVTLVCPQPAPEHHFELQKLWSNVKIHTYDVDQNQGQKFSLKKVIKSFEIKAKLSKEDIFRKSMLLSNTNLIDYYFQNLADIVFKLCAENQFDVAVVEFLDIAGVIHVLPRNLKKIFVHHEIRHRRMKLEYDTCKKKSIEDFWKVQNTKLLEIALLNKYDKVICLTEQDRLFLEEDGVVPEKLEVSPLSVQIADHNTNTPYSFRSRLVYLGPEVHFPNLDAVDWFLTNCWMPLKRLFPDLKFEIIGKWKKETKSFYSQLPGVKFHGFVENLDEVMEGAIMVVPLRIGSGMRMKILEGASWHMPIVSTNIGAEGLPMKNGENCFLADSPADFVEAVSKLIKSKELQEQFIENSREIIRTDYSIEECGKRRLEIFEKLVAINAG